MAFSKYSLWVSIVIKYYILGIVLFIPMIVSAQENPVQSHKFATPKALLAHKVQSKQQAIDLLQSNEFKQQLKALALKIDATHPSELTAQEGISLSSILEQHNKTIKLIETQKYPINFYHHLLYTQAQQTSGSSNATLEQQITKIFTHLMQSISDEQLYKTSSTMGWSLPMGQDYMLHLFKNYQQNDTLNVYQAIDLISNYQLYKTYQSVLPIVVPMIAAEENKRYVVDTDVLIKTPDGASISALVVRKRGDTQKRASAMQFTIYADEKWEIKQAMHAAAHGYVGVSANTRGKAKSPDKIIPWERDGEDATAVIDWVSKQSWSDGNVVMYGGSYLGFTQWAAAKHMHPALKTIVPIEAAHPFVGLPVENNIFITPNYQWAFHVTNNKTMDHSVYNDWQHWRKTYDELFETGRAFRDIDKVEGTPNPWFQKWLSHSSYDSYYQNMLPYQQDFKNINIPVLSITGYFGASISAAYFFNQHNQYNQNADHALLIGPYNHGTAQGIPRSYHSNYKLDEVALEKDTQEMTFEWFDHVLFNKPKPKLVKDKVNYQLMGSNTWQHKPSLTELNQQGVTYYLGAKQDDNKHYLLTTQPQEATDYISQSVDMSDRQTQHNAQEWQVIKKELNEPNGLVFVTEEFQSSQELTGSITGHFALAINKKDLDIGFKFYELKENGETFALSRYISRASYARDMSQRQLLTANQKTIIPIVNSTMTSKLIKKGSRLVMILNVNKNPGAQVNMGTGKDVSDETIADAGEPLEIKWFSDSKIHIPLKPWKM
ncbi:MAG: CocE/NonD family hydrolase [Paraglaciecola sp.]|uniref:CocE/NonD family hydrolase n=1 Tax=Paraglaciecola sp. TaxID=1920173 RepID=UPI003296B90A